MLLHQLVKGIFGIHGYPSFHLFRRCGMEKAELPGKDYLPFPIVSIKNVKRDEVSPC